MTLQQFKDKYGVRSCEKCCANCRYGRDLCDDGVVECVHPDLEESFYSELSGVCDAWSNMAETVGSRDAIEKAVVATLCGESMRRRVRKINIGG